MSRPDSAGRIRRLVPLTLLPLALLSSALASAPWLRAFPASVIAVPLFGAALVGVLVPVVVVNGIGVHRLWLTALIDAVLGVIYELLVVLRDPTGFPGLWRGLVHGPSQVLSAALPLVSPTELLVAPVAMCLVSATIVGECIARGWQTVLPYLTLLVAFGVSYAATARAITGTGDDRRYDTLLAAGLLLLMLSMRVAQSWVAQNEGARATQADGVLPLRGLVTGTALAVLIAAATVAVARTNAFPGPPRAARITPPLTHSTPLSPISFVAGLRPADPRNHGAGLFTVAVDRRASNYISVANLDTYDGDSWSFERTFPPSGGIIPADPVGSLHPSGPAVTQQYTITGPALPSAPWMPYLQRAQRVTGVDVDVDADSGMITPSQPLSNGQAYRVTSTSVSTDLLHMRGDAAIDGSATTDLPTDVSGPLATLVTTLEAETNQRRTAGVAFLQAVAKDLRAHAGLAGGTARARGGTGTSFADVLTSIRVNHSGTPEQFATLMCLVALSLHVPARLATGFRVGMGPLLPGRAVTVRAGEAWTWVEIPVAGAGWVVLDPSPNHYGGGGPKQEQHPAAAQPSVGAPASNVLQPVPSQSVGVLPTSPLPAGPHTGGSIARVLVLVAAALLVIAALIMLLLRKRVRARRRRRAGDPRRRVLGAWQESLDLLQEAGLRDLSSLTSREVSAATGDRFGREPAAQAQYLGDAANAAIFSPASRVGPGEADAAWRAHLVLRNSVRGRLSLTERLGAGLRYQRARPPVTVPSPASWAVALRDRTATARTPGRHAAAAPRGRRTRRR